MVQIDSSYNPEGKSQKSDMENQVWRKEQSQMGKLGGIIDLGVIWTNGENVLDKIKYVS